MTTDTVEMEWTDIKERCVAIVCFGPATVTTGMAPGHYYQVTIDPAQISPSGDFIRFGNSKGDEIVGWQRCGALTVVEVLGTWDSSDPPVMKYGTQGFVTMLTTG